MRNGRDRRGFAFVTTLWVIIVLTALTLTMAYSVRVEAVAAANRMSMAQADAAERGVEQFLLAAADSEAATPGSTAKVSMEDIRVGDCHGWVLKADPDNDTVRGYGMTDEAGKLDLNSATYGQLQNLPGLTQDIASSIVIWRTRGTGGGAASGGMGASDSYYQGLPNPYNCKHAPFETVEELMLIKDVDGALMYGSDRNRNGVMDGKEQGGGVSIFGGAAGSELGIFPLVTVYGAIAGTVRAATTSATGGTATKAVSVNQNPASLESPSNALRKALTNALGASRTEEIIQRMPQSGGPAANYTSTFQWAVDVRLTSAEYSKVIHLVTATAAGGGGGGATAATAKINVNSAPAGVLLCLPQLTQADADAIVAHRQENPTPTDPTDISWLLDAVSGRGKQLAIANLVSGQSSCFSGDIVATSGDGRGFKRVRVVIDARKSPAKIIYRRDLTSYGWPLSADVRTTLRSGGAAASGSALLPGKGGTTQ